MLMLTATPGGLSDPGLVLTVGGHERRSLFCDIYETVYLIG